MSGVAELSGGLFMRSDASGRSGFTRDDFSATRWTIVIGAADTRSPSAREALEQLCRTYWMPLYAYVRRHGHSPQDAEDLTQAFFAKFLEKNYIADVRRERGKFRAFLLTALKRFLANEWDHQHAQKRGGFQTFISIDKDLAESRFAPAQGKESQPDLVFEQQWATTLLEQVRTRLREECVAHGKGPQFEQLHGCLVKDASAQPYAEIAARLSLTEAAVKMAVRRLRARYREILLEEVANTVASPDEVDEEIRHLFSVFSG